MRYYLGINQKPSYRNFIEIVGWIQVAVFLACAFGFTPPGMDYWFSPAFYGRQVNQLLADSKQGE